MPFNYGKFIAITIPDSAINIRDILNQCGKTNLLNHQKPIIMNQVISLAEFILIVLICYPFIILGKTIVEHIKEK
jgi:hypothetical protein